MLKELGLGCVEQSKVELEELRLGWVEQSRVELDELGQAWAGLGWAEQSHYRITGLGVAGSVAAAVCWGGRFSVPYFPLDY